MRLFRKLNNNLDYSNAYSVNRTLKILYGEFELATKTRNINYAKEVTNTLLLIYGNCKTHYNCELPPLDDYNRGKILKQTVSLLNHMTKGMKQEFNYKLEDSSNET